MKDYVRSRVLERYLEVSEARRKAVDLGIKLRRELDESRARVKSLSRELADFKQEHGIQHATIRNLEASLEFLRNEHAGLSGEIKNLNQEYQREKQEREHLALEHARLVEHLGTALESLEVSQEESEKLILELQASKQREKTTHQALEQHQSYQKTLEKERDSLKEALGNLKEASSKQALAHEKLIGIHAFACRELEALKSVHAVLEGKLLEVSNHASQKDVEFRALHDEHVHILEVLRDEREIRTQREEELTRVSLVAEERGGSLKHLEAEHGLLVGQIEELKRIQKNDQNEHEKLQTLVGEFQELHEKERAEHARLVAVIGNLDGERLELETRLRELGSENRNLQGILNSIQSKWVYRQYRRLKRLLGKSS